MSKSVHDRLLKSSKIANRPFNELVQYYALERWLYRLSKSAYRELFILKGALMLQVWKMPINRPTRDIDLLGKMSNDLEAVRSVIAEVCAHSIEDDGLIFDPASVVTTRIAEDADYEGVRASFQAHLGSVRLPMQIDIGFSDVITPGPVEIAFPSILDHPNALLRAYNRETAIAEKFEAMVKLGELNSRMKDFFDVWLLARSSHFAGVSLADAIRQTFFKRETAIEINPICFSEAFANDPSKAAQWRAFVRRGKLDSTPAEFPEIVMQVRGFLRPIAAAIVETKEFTMLWTNNGPWHS